MSELIKNTIPNAVELERLLIGCLLYDPNKIIPIHELVEPQDFYDIRYKTIFSTLINLAHKKVNVSIPLLQEELKLQKMEQLTSNQFYNDILQDITSSIYAYDYAKKIKEKAILRLLLNNCHTIEKNIYESENDLDKVLEKTEELIFKTLRSKKSSEFKDISLVLIDVIDLIDNNAKNDTHLTGVTTGFIDLDNRTSGFQNSDLILIAARPAMGKTALCLNMARAASMNGVTTAIFSLEMSSEQLGQRLLAIESGINFTKLRESYSLNSQEWSEILTSSDRLSKAKLLIDDSGNVTINALRSKCRKAKLEQNLGLIIIDYLQLMNGNSRENRQQEISEISRGLKLLAKELNIPIVALSQLSRAVEARADRRPMLSDLRESGAIEQDADVVMFIYRDDYYNKDSEEKGVAEIIIAKQRNGATGTVKLRWIGERTKFVDLETV